MNPGTLRASTIAAAMSAVMPALLACAVLPAALLGQEVIRISSTPTCPKCRIELEHVVTFGGSPEDSVDVGRFLRRNSRGEYLTRNPWAPHEVAVFSATGKLLKLFGRTGEGPGDYGRVDFLEIGRGDTLHVFDLRLRRRTLLAPGSRSVGRIAPLPVLPYLEEESLILGPQAYVLLPDGRYIVNAERGDSALHLVGVDGELVRSFGVGYREEELPPPPSKRHLSVLQRGEAAALRRVDVIYRQLAAGGEGRIWAAYRNRYEIELWDTAGVRLRRLVRETEWFKPWRSDDWRARARRHIPREREGSGTDAPPPSPYPPMFLGLQQDDEGRIWTLLIGGNPLGAPQGNDTTGPIVEVLDPRAGRLVVSVRVGQGVEEFVGTRLVAARETRASDGARIVKVFRMVLVEA